MMLLTSTNQHISHCRLNLLVCPLEEPLPLLTASRRQCAPRQDENLMESWDSLTKFNQCQRGRISNMGFEGDIFDEFLQRQVRSLPGPPLGSASASRSPLLSVNTAGAPNDGADDDDPSAELEDDFEIPVLPQGQRLVVNILSTWGDRHYVGLNGLEVFSSSGEPVKPARICADPPDINVLPAYGKDPRVVSNLIDGVNRTQDDMHLWLAPFTPGCSHTVFLDFGACHQVAMIRVWNYNKSRIHSFRGVKEVEMVLDGRCIFRGEIAKAAGTLSGGRQAHVSPASFTPASSRRFDHLGAAQVWTSLGTPSFSPPTTRSWRPCLGTTTPSCVRATTPRSWSTRRSFSGRRQLMGRERRDLSLRLASERKTLQ